MAIHIFKPEEDLSPYLQLREDGSAHPLKAVVEELIEARKNEVPFEKSEVCRQMAPYMRLPIANLGKNSLREIVTACLTSQKKERRLSSSASRNLAFYLDSLSDAPDLKKLLKSAGVSLEIRRDTPRLDKRQRGHLWRIARRNLLGQILLRDFKQPPETVIEGLYWRSLLNMYERVKNDLSADNSSILGRLAFDSALAVGRYLYNAEKTPLVKIGPSDEWGRPAFDEFAQRVPDYHRAVTHAFSPELIRWASTPKHYMFGHSTNENGYTEIG